MSPVAEAIPYRGTVDRAGHRLLCSDVRDVDFAAFLDGQQADVLYTDPPWGSGTGKMWATMARTMTGVAVEGLSHDELLDVLGRIISDHVSGWVFVETGMRFAESMRERMALHTMGTPRIYVEEYRSGDGMRPCALVAAHKTDPSAVLPVDPTGLSGYQAVALVIASVARYGGLLLDPFTGKGYSLRAAMQYGMRFRGVEFNGARLAKAAQRLPEM